MELHVTENIVVNLTLEVGEITEIINVQNEATHVETRSGEFFNFATGRTKQIAMIGARPRLSRFFRIARRPLDSLHST